MGRGGIRIHVLGLGLGFVRGGVNAGDGDVVVVLIVWVGLNCEVRFGGGVLAVYRFRRSLRTCPVFIFFVFIFFVSCSCGGDFEALVFRFSFLFWIGMVGHATGNEQVKSHFAATIL